MDDLEVAVVRDASNGYRTAGICILGEGSALAYYGATVDTCITITEGWRNFGVYEVDIVIGTKRGWRRRALQWIQVQWIQRLSLRGTLDDFSMKHCHYFSVALITDVKAVGNLVLYLSGMVYVRWPCLFRFMGQMGRMW